MILRQLLSRGVDPNVSDSDGRQPVHWAAAAGAGDALLALVQHGDADIHAADRRNGLTALHCAAAGGHVDCINQLITLCGARVDVADQNGCTALFYAAAQGHIECVETLLSLGACVMATDGKGRTAAHGAAVKGHLAVLAMLQCHDSTLGWAVNTKGNMPLHDAVLTGRRDVVRWLLAQCPSAVEEENGAGRQVLHLAVTAPEAADMVRLLVGEFRAPVNAICRGSRDHRQLYTPLDLAQRNGNSNKAVSRYLRQVGGLSAKQLISAKTLRQAFAEAVEQKRRSTEEDHLLVSSSNSHAPLLYSPEVELSPISPFSWRSCFTVNTEQAADSSRGFIINKTADDNGELAAVVDRGEGGLSKHHQRWQSVSGSDRRNGEKDEDGDEGQSTDSSSSDSIFEMDVSQAMMLIPRTHSAPDIRSAVGRIRLPSAFKAQSSGNGMAGLGGSLDAGLDGGVVGNNDDRNFPDMSELLTADSTLRHFDFNHGNNDECSLTVLNALDECDSDRKSCRLPTPPLSSSYLSAIITENDSRQDNGPASEESDRQAAAETIQQEAGRREAFVYEATFCILTTRHPRPRPKTTSCVEQTAASTGDIWRRQRARRRQMHEQLLRQQLAAVERLRMRTHEPRHEGTVVKRLVGDFNAAVTHQLIGLRAYKGPYTFDNFEAYLEDALEDMTV